MGVVLLAGRDGLWPELRRALGVGLLGAAIGAVQLVPTALLTTLSVRTTALSPNDLFASAATPFDILAFGFQGAFARLQGGSWDIYSNWYPDGTFALLEVAAYVGLPVLGPGRRGVAPAPLPAAVIALVVLIAIPVVEALASRDPALGPAPQRAALARAGLPAGEPPDRACSPAWRSGRRPELGMRPCRWPSGWRSRSPPTRHAGWSPSSRRTPSTPSRSRSPLRQRRGRRGEARPRAGGDAGPVAAPRGARGWGAASSSLRSAAGRSAGGPGVAAPVAVALVRGAPAPVRAGAQRQRRDGLVHEQGLRLRACRAVGEPAPDADDQPAGLVRGHAGPARGRGPRRTCGCSPRSTCWPSKA